MELPPKGPEPDDEVGETEEQEETAAQAGFLGARDVEAFKQLFDTHYESLYRYALRYLRSAEEANDVVHDVFLQMWRHRQRIGLGRDLRAYLYTTTRNHALDRLKRRKVEDSFRERADVVAAQEGPDAVSELESRELAATIQRAIDSLPRRQREVLRMRWHQHLSYEEIAKALNISPKTVAIHLSRGLQHLREALPNIAE